MSNTIFLGFKLVESLEIIKLSYCAEDEKYRKKIKNTAKNFEGTTDRINGINEE